MDKQLIQRLAREAGFSVDMLGNLFVAEPDGTCGDEIDRLAELIVEQCVQVAHTRAGYWDDNRAKIVAEDVATGINARFGPEKSRDDNKPQPFPGMDHLYSMLPPGILRTEEEVKAIREARDQARPPIRLEGARFVCDVPGKFLDMTEHAGRLIILTESGVFELRPGETALRQLQPMTPQDAAELDMFNHKQQQEAGVWADGSPQWRYTTYPFQFKKED